MQSTVRIISSAIFLTAALVSCYHDQNGVKLRRDGVLSLYPFPRVGRASQSTWQIPMNGLYLDDYEPMDKRQLYAFPRVGRSDSNSLPLRGPPHRASQGQMVMRRNDSPGMWFGPRLGRSLKEEEDTMIQQQAERSDPEQVENVDYVERKKRQTKPL